MIVRDFGWPLRPLEQLCGVNIGKTPARKEPRYWVGGKPWLSIGDMNGSRYVERTREEISDVAVSECGCKQVPADTVLMSFKLSLGKVAITCKPIFTNEAIAAFPIKNPSVLDRDFLYWALQVIDLEEWSDRAAKGKTLNKAKLQRLGIPLPPVDEQRRIAAILDKADAIRRKREHMLVLADDFLRSAFLEMFGDPAFNPKSYNVQPVEKVLSQSRAGTQSGPFGSSLKKHEYVSEGIPVWGIDNVQPNRFVPGAKLFITKKKFEQLERYSVRRGDILISRAGTVGRMCIARPEEPRSIISTNLVRVCMNTEYLLPEYFVNLMTYFPHRLGGLKTNQKENAFTFLNPKTLKALEIPIPPIDDQLRFVELLGKRGALVSHTENEIGMALTLFASLSQRAFRGEL